MKTDGLKRLIKEAVREAIQEELKDILLEAVRSPKQIIRESIQPIETPKPSFTQPTMDLRSKYKDVLGETALSFTSNDVQQPFRPQSSDPVNGNLGTGDVGMDQIMSLLNTK
jgi:hypothetical protein